MTPPWDWIAASGEVRVGVRTSRRDQTTSTVLVSADRALLVDPAWDPDELAAIADELSATGLAVTAGFATHPHHDHLLWHPGFGNAPRWASRSTAEAAANGRDMLIEALGVSWPPELGALVGVVAGLDSDRIPWDGPTVELITHDAHAPGHTALWVPAVRVLIAGDMLSDVELPLLEESTVVDYQRGLAALKPYAAQASTIIPGHGSIAIGTDAALGRWRADRDYLHDLSAAPISTDRRLRNPGMSGADARNRKQATG